MRTGSVSTVSLGTVTTEAFSKEEYAWAATRSTGVPALPIRASSRPTVSTMTPSGALDGDLHAVARGDGGAVVQTRAAAPAE